jgi:hypothetical protein
MIVVSSGALATPNNNCTNGNGSASSATTRSGSANLSTKKQGLLITFNLIVEFFVCCNGITKVSKLKN